MAQKLKSFELKKEFQKMKHDELSDYKFLSEFIFHKTGITLPVRQLKIPEPHKLTCWNGLGTRQYPEELAKLLVFLYENKDQINSYFEIGVNAGGSFFVIDSFLRAVNPSMGESLGIDTVSRPRKLAKLTEYHEANPQSSSCIMNSKNLVLKKHYDFCFIDGDHTLAEHDYLKVKDFMKIIAFHDIKLVPEVNEFWDSLAGNKIEFINSDKRFPIPLGIGVLLPEEK